MEHAAPATVPVKLTLFGTKRRSRLDIPLKFSQLCEKVKYTFPDVKDFNLQYVDEEGDNILVSSDADMEEARAVFEDLGRVLSFVVNKTAAPPASAAPPAPPLSTAHDSKSKSIPSTEDSKSKSAPCGFGARRGPWNGRCRRGPWHGHCRRGPWNGQYGRRGPWNCHGGHPLMKVMQSPHVQEGLKSLFANVPVFHFGITCDGSNEHPLVGKRFHKIGHNYDLNETEFLKLTHDEQQKYEVIAYPGATPVPVKIPQSKTAVHHGVICDGSNQNPLLGVRYHKIGHNYDLNETEFSKLAAAEQKKYEMITHPGATPIPVTVLDCVFVRDVTIPDGQVISAGNQFKKTWLVKTGANGWPAGCTLTHIHGDKMNGTTRVVLPPQKPLSHVQISIDLTAPSRPGKVTSKWRVAGPDGKLFGHTLWTDIVVQPSATSESASAVVSPKPSTSVTETTSASTSAAAASSSAAPVISGPLQQLLEMGFDLPVETLQRALTSVGGNVPAAVNLLFSSKKF